MSCNNCIQLQERIKGQSELIDTLKSDIALLEIRLSSATQFARDVYMGEYPLTQNGGRDKVVLGAIKGAPSEQA